MYKEARKRAKLSIEEAAPRLHIATRTLCNYESGASMASPETALAMSREYNSPALTMLYCRKECAIGKAYAYEILNNVDLHPAAIINKYRQENREANEAIEQLAIVMLNKTTRCSCTPEELAQIHRLALELLDLQHVIETLKLRLWDYCEVDQLVKEHNSKCLKKRYYDPGKTDLQLAG
jgi:transcriptional regulator with XRE-family HTH domain